TVQGLEETNNYVMTKQVNHSELDVQFEGALNNLYSEITAYLVNILSRTLLEGEVSIHTALMDSVRDFERIGDHFENIIELVDYKITNKINLTEKAHEDLHEMFDLTILTVQ